MGNLRDSFKNIIPNNEKYYFISKHQQIIKLEDNYSILDVLQKDNSKYRIDFKTIEFYENKPLLINVYLNDYKNSALFIERNTNLSKVREKLNDKISKNDNIFFATTGDFLIKNNLEEFKIEKIIRPEGKENNIFMYELNYYYSKKLINDLKEMYKEIEKGNAIDWFKQAQFFINVKELAGEEIANQLSKELETDLDNQEQNNDETPGNDGCQNQNEIRMKKDIEFIKRYLKLLSKDMDNNSPPPSNGN